MAYKAITEERFKEAKDLLFRGDTIGEVIQKTGISRQTMSLIERVKDLAEYRELSRGYWGGKNAKTKQKSAVSEQPQQPSADTWYTITIPSSLYEDVLRDIGNGVEIKQALIGFIIGRARKETE